MVCDILNATSFNASLKKKKKHTIASSHFNMGPHSSRNITAIFLLKDENDLSDVEEQGSRVQLHGCCLRAVRAEQNEGGIRSVYYTAQTCVNSPRTGC